MIKDRAFCKEDVVNADALKFMVSMRAETSKSQDFSEVFRTYITR